MKFSPIILDSVTDSGRHLNRIESQAKDEKTEGWLQQLIFEHPDLLPVDEFDESFAPLIPIGREVATKSGAIDNLYISPVGRLTIVETKLWKNPEKHRTVVAHKGVRSTLGFCEIVNVYGSALRLTHVRSVNHARG